MQPDQDLEEYILSILNVAKKQLGPDKLREALSKSNLYADGREELLREFVIARTCKEFTISYNKLINGSSNGNRTTALMVTAMLLQKYVSYNQSQISETLKKSVGRITQYFTEYNELDAKLRHHHEILNKIEAIEKNIGQFNEHLNEK